MIPTPPLPQTIGRLVDYLFETTRTDPLAAEVAGWLVESARFRSFVEMHRDKIRKKLRGAADMEARRDVRAELRVGSLLLADRRNELAFEAYGSGNPGPDFTVTFRGERPFNLEVTRLRAAPTMTGLVNAMLGKLRQLPPSVPNVLLLAVGPGEERLDPAAAGRALRARADAKDEAFFVARGVGSSRAFHDRFLRLGVVLVWSEAASGDDRVIAWRNPSARIAVPERALRACLSDLRGE